MLPRRDLLKTSLTVGGCAACGALGIGACGRAARADRDLRIGLRTLVHRRAARDDHER
jgi:hypothetical protein